MQSGSRRRVASHLAHAETCRKLRLPLVGNVTYSVGSRVDAALNFDTCDPYKYAKVMISLSRHDSYNLGVAKAMARGVPAVWDDGNEQIRDMWSEFPSAIPLYSLRGTETLESASQKTETSILLIRKRVEEGWQAFLAL